MKKNALIVLAKGFEEIEAVTPIDILRRANVEVIIAGLDSLEVEGAHGVTIACDIVLDDDNIMPDALILPGGLPGAENLANSTRLKELIIKMDSEKKLIAAICASPALVLERAGVLKGRQATCYPSLEKNFSANVKFVKSDVVQDGHIITSKGPATAFAFGLAIAENLVGKSKRDALVEQMLYR